MTGEDLGEIINQFLADQDAGRFDVAYFRDLLTGVAKNVDILDGHLQPLLDRDVDKVDPVERAALRLGVYELAMHPEVPYRVVINEAVELAKVFGAEQGHRYVNGVLDKLGKTLRPFEKTAS
jgi:N utilization substance protein B